MNDSNDRRNDLCSRFRRSLSAKDADREYFDEDDLIEIFDYAGDLNDDYLRFEVLLCGARYYPESTQLKERRALLYANYGDETSTKFLEDNTTSQGALWDIARIRNNSPMGAEAAKALDLLLTSYSEFDDEEVIQLVDLASQLDQTDWLVNNLAELKAHVSYMPTLLYEIAVMLEMEGRYKEAIKLLEELTDLEPYNEQYWFMLAQEFDLDDNRIGALQSLDLALAILPDDQAMRFYHARLLSRDDATMDQSLEEMAKLAADYPADINICRYLAALYIENSEKFPPATAATKATAILRKCLTFNPGERKLATDLLVLGTIPSSELIAQIDKNQPPVDIADWISWAQELHDLDAFQAAIDILTYCENKIGKVDTDLNAALIINYFMLQDFQMVCTRFETQTQGDVSSSIDKAALIFTMYAISLTKCRRAKTAAEFAKLILHMLLENDNGAISNSLNRIGTGVVLTDIIDKVESRRKIDWDKYDPLSAWISD